MDYTLILEQILASDEAILNRLEFITILLLIITTVLIFNTFRKKR